LKDSRPQLTLIGNKTWGSDHVVEIEAWINKRGRVIRVLRKVKSYRRERKANKNLLSDLLETSIL